MTTGTARLTHGGRFLTVTTMRKRGKKNVPLVVTYVVSNPGSDPAVAFPVLALTKEDGVTYHCAITEWGARCDCVDGEIREKRGSGRCKHIRSLVAVGLLPRDT